ncbi:hypothetical protein V8D89_007938 [Ganoderma adspersum]
MAQRYCGLHRGNIELAEVEEGSLLLDIVNGLHPGILPRLQYQSVKYGQRIVYLGSTFLMFIACLWTAISPGLTFIRVSRIFQGIVIAPAQCLVAATLEHIYFVHERRSRSIIWTFSLIGGTTLGLFIYGYVIQDLSWQFGFWFVSIACGLSFISVFSFVPETTRYKTLATLSPPKKAMQADINDKDAGKEMPPSRTEAAPEHVDLNIPARRMDIPSVLSQLKIYNGTFSDESFWKIFTRPFALIVSPVTWFIFLTLSMQTVRCSVLSLCSSMIFTTAYHFDAAENGLTHLGSLVGVILAMLVTGPLSDRAIVWMSQHNHGVYELEFRLIVMLAMLFGVFGYVGWAVGSGNHMPWIGAVVCFAMVNFGLLASGGAAVTYLLDTHGGNAQYVLTITRSVNYLIFYAVTFVANGIVVSAASRSCTIPDLSEETHSHPIRPDVRSQGGRTPI